MPGVVGLLEEWGWMPGVEGLLEEWGWLPGVEGMPGVEGFCAMMPLKVRFTVSVSSRVPVSSWTSWWILRLIRSSAAVRMDRSIFLVFEFR